MKTTILLVIMFSFGANAQELNVMTFNIRYDNPGDSLNAWPYRKDKVASQVKFHKAHIIGMQEALIHQINDLQERLPGYKWFGAGRDDGKSRGEFSPVFYDTNRLQLINDETFWLSEDPSMIGKKGWDASFPRVVSWAKFRDRSTKKIFFLFNTHYDHMGKLARAGSSKLLLNKINAEAGSTPVIVTGDFNAQPSDEPIVILLDKSNPQHLTDTKTISLEPHYGPDGTFNGFKQHETSKEPIDYIFIKKGIKVLSHATLSQTWMGRFSSDHFPVFTQLKIE